jgi:hypothetical protein
MSQFNLQDIIRVYPNLEPYCAGFAPSKGRRCHNATNAANRARACALLDKGTMKLQAGQAVNGLLEELAPLVLCLRNHQNQASDLVVRWKRSIHGFRQSQRPENRRQSVETSSEDPVELQEQYAVLAERVTSALDNLHRFENRLLTQETRFRLGSHEVDSHLETRLERTRGPNLDRWMIQVTVSTRRLQQIIDDGDPLRSSSRLATAQTGSTEEREVEEPRHTERETGPGPRDERSQPSHPPRSSRSGTRPSTTPAERDVLVTPTTSTTAARRSVPRPSSHSSRPNRTINVRGGHTVSRRPIEEEEHCGICLETLLDNLRHDDTDDGYDNEDENSASSIEDEEGEEAAVDIVWCKARCGNNFHSECLYQWIDSCHANGRIPTCPTCRARWVD